ncbi:MAG: TonB-dependent receptor [Melioribacteraceae bacterium]|nr:TonB-dependent receptor [Melioribacteraceae bacterium]
MRKVKLLLTLLVLVTLIFPSRLWCGTTGKISGKIVDAETGELLIGANIMIMGTNLGGSADIEGTYYIINIPPGVYDVKASFIGYQSVVKKQVVVNVDRTTSIDFELTIGDLQTEVIEIIASKKGIIKDLTASSEQISADEIQKMPVESIGDILSLQTGITQDAGGGLHLRGGRSAEIEYMVDGISVSNPFGGGMAVSVQNNTIQQMEVISGTFNAEYGRAMSGIVNIVTKEGTEKFRGSISGYTGDFLTTHDDMFFNIDDINPLSQKYFEGFVSGPIPFVKNANFFLSTRITDVENWLYGQRNHSPSDSADFSSTNPENWTIQYGGDSSIVEMNPSQSRALQGKLSFRLFNNLKVSYNLISDYSKWRGYNHSQKYNPDHDGTSKSWGINNILSFTHTLSPSTVHELRIANYTYNFESSKYKDPFDPRYEKEIHNQANTPSDIFAIGLVSTGFSERYSNTLAIKYDLTSQIHRSHLVKMGVEYRQNKLEDEYFVVRRDEGTNWQLQVDDVSSMAHNYYKKKPIEISAYIQDKIEIEDLIVNVGLRFDYFNAKSYVPKDFTNPSNISTGSSEPKSFDDAYEDVDAKMQLSPRLGMAFPISDEGTLHASFGQFFQIPELGRLYENPDFEVIGTFESFIGNADLEAERTTIYEIGLQQMLTPNIVLDATCYYKDVRNLAGTKLYETFDQVSYGKYTNYDYGSVWGFTLALDLLRAGIVSSTVDYTYQVAEGNGSDPKQAFYDAGNNDESTKTLVPLNWDQRHVFNWVLNLNGKDWGISTISRYQSGYPFSPSTTYIQTSNVQLRNMGRRKPRVNVDVRLYKNLEIAGLSTTFFMQVENLLDETLSENFPELKQDDIEGHESKEYINTLYDYRYNPASQPRPRLVKVGLSVNF